MVRHPQPKQPMHNQSNRQLQERLTSLPVSDVLDAATRFFARQSGVYSAFIEKQGPTHVVLRGQGGEEIVIAARVTDDGVMVTGSTYLFDQQVARFLQSLAPAERPAAAASAASAPPALPAGESLSGTATAATPAMPMPTAPAKGANP
jgi:hypothetical protein